MATTFQNRLAGTVIVVALAVIFLPDILDGKSTETTSLNMKIPGRPSLEPAVYENPFPVRAVQERSGRKVEIVKEAAIDDEVSIQSDSPTLNDTQSAPEPEVKPLQQQPSTAINDKTAVTQISEDFPIADVYPGANVNKSWVIQLGSFRHQKNVRDLVDKLNKSGYRAFTNKVKTSSGDLTKVFVGPDLKREKLSKAIPHLNELTGLEGRLTEFDVQ